jgi:hypothetical protein
MGGSCNNCNHYSCVNGDSGVYIYGECERCRVYMHLCSNDLTEEELKTRCNGEACGCGDNLEEWICDDCR